MTKRQKVIVGFVAIVAIFVLAAAGSFVYAAVSSKDEQVAQNTEAGSVSANLTPGGATTIPLGEKSKSSSGGLSVDDSANYGANLGSGSTSSNNIGGSGNSTSSAQDFKQYEQYKDSKEVYFGEIVEGNGAAAQKDNQLAVTYKGYLTNGTLFDQSRTGANGQKEPLLFTLGAGQLISGFEQGVAGMKAGGTRRIIIPPALGYGDKQQNGIPPNSVLIFDVQLLTVQ